MTVSLPMCAIDFTNDAMGPEEAAIADRIAELKEQMGEDLLIQVITTKGTKLSCMPTY